MVLAMPGQAWERHRAPETLPPSITFPCRPERHVCENMDRFWLRRKELTVSIIPLTAWLEAEKWQVCAEGTVCERASEDKLGSPHVVILSTVSLRGGSAVHAAGEHRLFPPTTRPWARVAWVSRQRRPGRTKETPGRSLGCPWRRESPLWGPHTPSHPWELGQCQRRASSPFQGGFLPLLLRAVVQCRCHLFLWGDREETLMGQEISDTFIQAILWRIWDRYAGWCSPRIGGGWNCPFGPRKWPALSQGLFCEAKLDLGSGLPHCRMGLGWVLPLLLWGPACLLFSSMGKVEFTYLHRKMKKNCFRTSVHVHTDQTTKTDTHKFLFLHYLSGTSLYQPSWKYLIKHSCNLSPVLSWMNEN